MGVRLRAQKSPKGYRLIRFLIQKGSINGENAFILQLQMIAQCVNQKKQPKKIWLQTA
jgi:hypothetical protein